MFLKRNSHFHTMETNRPTTTTSTTSTSTHPPTARVFEKMSSFFLRLAGR